MAILTIDKTEEYGMKIYNLRLFRFVLLQVSCSNTGGSPDYIEEGFFSEPV
jgi:hypothetical protein